MNRLVYAVPFIENASDSEIYIVNTLIIITLDARKAKI